MPQPYAVGKWFYFQLIIEKNAPNLSFSFLSVFLHTCHTILEVIRLKNLVSHVVVGA
jgi:hypothetical protein